MTVKGSVIILFSYRFWCFLVCVSIFVFSLIGLHHTTEIGRHLRSIWAQSKKRCVLLSSELITLLSWEKHHVNHLKLFTGIIQALNKIKKIIYTILDTLLQKICFGKLQAVRTYFLWTGTNGTMKEKLISNYLSFFFCTLIVSLKIFLLCQMEKDHI